MKDKINNKVPLDDLVLREEPEVLTRWQDPTIKEYRKEIDQLNKAFDELESFIKFQRKISLSLNGYGVSLCDKFSDKLNELRNK